MRVTTSDPSFLIQRAREVLSALNFRLTSCRYSRTWFDPWGRGKEGASVEGLENKISEP